MLFVNNRLPWLKVDDYVLVDPDWFAEVDYRTKKSLNQWVLADALRDGQLRIATTSPQGQSLKLLPIHETAARWIRPWSLKITTSHHSKRHPVTFSSRHISRRNG